MVIRVQFVSIIKREEKRAGLYLRSDLDKTQHFREVKTDQIENSTNIFRHYNNFFQTTISIVYLEIECALYFTMTKNITAIGP